MLIEIEKTIRAKVKVKLHCIMNKELWKKTMTLSLTMNELLSKTMNKRGYLNMTINSRFVGLRSSLIFT